MYNELKQQITSDKVDFRAFHVLYNHKLIMQLLLKNLTQLGYHFYEINELCIKQINESLQLRNMLLKQTMKNHIKIDENLYVLERIKNNDKVIFSEVLHEIETNPKQVIKT